MSDSFPCVTVDSLAALWKGSIKIGPFGSQLKREDMVEHGHKVYGQENVIAVDWSAGDRRVTQAKFNALRSCELQPGDVVLSMMGTIGKCAVFPSGAEPGLMDSHLLRIQPNVELVTREYLALVLQAENVVGRQVAAMSHGSIMAGLSSSIVRRFKVPLPPLNEQPVLSAVLDTLDTTIRRTEAIIAKLKLVKQGLLHDLLTRGIDANGELRPPQSEAPHLYMQSPLGWIPKGWNCALFGELCKSSAFGPRFPSDAYDENGPIAMLRTTDMDSEGNISLGTMPRAAISLATFRDHFLEPGDIVISRSGTCGVAGVFAGHDIPVVPGAFLIRFRLYDQALSGFYRRYFNSSMGRPRLERLAEGGVQKNIKGTDVLRLPVPVLPSEEAITVAHRIECVEHNVDDNQRQLRKLMLEKSGLMDDLLTGRVRVTPLLEAATS